MLRDLVAMIPEPQLALALVRLRSLIDAPAAPAPSSPPSEGLDDLAEGALREDC
jgi:hypothetical protein